MPVGPEGQRWSTRAATERVLLVVHNVTSATRLLDVLPLFAGDTRVQCLATCTGSSPFQHGVPELLAEAGLPVVPWEQAREVSPGLVISASYGGQLHHFKGKLAVLSHGVGYNKRLSTPDTGHRTPDTGHRTPDTGHRTPDTGHRTPDLTASPSAGQVADAPPPVFGLSPEWLLHDGEPLATATVLSHPEQLTRLRRACPQAARTAVLAGDPCYDRLLAALPYRDRFRRALGVSAGQRLIVLNSTWGPRSLFGDGNDVLPWLLPRLTDELPTDEYRLCAVLHPNIWHGHGPGQVRAWLARAERAGLTLVPPLGPWRQVLAAADAVIGDHGSVTYYAAAIGTPVLLAAFPAQDLDPASPVAELGRLAPRLRPRGPLRPQLDALLATHRPDRYDRLTAQATSDPGASAALLRRVFYDILGIPEPATPAFLPRLREPTPLTGDAALGAPFPPQIPGPPETTAVPAPLRPPLTPLRVLTRVVTTGAPGTPPEIAVTRYAGGTRDPEPPSSEPYEGTPPPGASGDDAEILTGVHTAVHEDTPDAGRLSLADLVLHDRRDEPEAWAHETVHRYPHSAMAVCVTAPDRCLVRVADGSLVTLEASRAADGYRDACDPTAYASALYAWYELGRPLEDLGPVMTVLTGGARHHVTVSVSRARR
ncbi:hypothetical protein [Streptomyces sp. NPDC003077]|uniref:hypothetical protein n=1 Tax=Streptomyces sp. NPDC003077 TaxID=3154443 RepID=UPI00339FC607